MIRTHHHQIIIVRKLHHEFSQRGLYRPAYWGNSALRSHHKLRLRKRSKRRGSEERISSPGAHLQLRNHRRVLLPQVLLLPRGLLLSLFRRLRPLFGLEKVKPTFTCALRFIHWVVPGARFKRETQHNKKRLWSTVFKKAVRRRPHREKSAFSLLLQRRWYCIILLYIYSMSTISLERHPVL